MKNLKEIIQEKLKIGSKSKVDVNDNIGLLNEILYVLSINDKNPLQYPKDRLDFIKEEIQNWISKNNVKTVRYAADKDDLEVYKDYYIKDHKDILNYFEKDFNIYKEIKKEYGESHHIYSNNYCEIRYTKQVFIIAINDPTYNTNLDFYIIKDNGEN